MNIVKPKIGDYWRLIRSKAGYGRVVKIAAHGDAIELTGEIVATSTLNEHQSRSSQFHRDLANYMDDIAAAMKEFEASL